MKYFKVELKLRSALVTPLQSDTIFGHLCWAVVNRYGETVLKELITSENPPVVFSNCFPASMLPRPILEPMTVEQRGKVKEKIVSHPRFTTGKDRNPDFEAEVVLKKLKKRRWVKMKTMQSLLGGLNEYRLVEKLIDDYADSLFAHNGGTGHKKQVIEYERERNIIDRVSGMTLKEGGLFTVTETRYKKPLFDLYVIMDENGPLNVDNLKILIEDVFERSGYGADASTGAGHFKIVGFEPIDYLAKPEDVSGYAVMSLSNFVPDRENIIFDSLKYKLISKFGMLGDRYALRKNPFKKPMVMMEAGATFEPVSSRCHFGRMLRNIHTDPAIVHNACLIPFYFKEEVSAQ